MVGIYGFNLIIYSCKAIKMRVYSFIQNSHNISSLNVFMSTGQLKITGKNKLYCCYNSISVVSYKLE